ncbi:hypothetical protein AB0J21_29985 [Streptomyces sp. NPDC049954]|uniref:hypothetical protein n=1 Tax=Streptomyces sp. NPDC049954 TaxID=3155779 RepID=UPI0034163F82
MNIGLSENVQGDAHRDGRTHGTRWGHKAGPFHRSQGKEGAGIDREVVLGDVRRGQVPDVVFGQVCQHPPADGPEISQCRPGRLRAERVGAEVCDVRLDDVHQQLLVPERAMRIGQPERTGL